jgi:DHA2 family multidrug resistance protein
MPLEKSNSVAGLTNFMRNIGSSVGTSMVTTLIARRSQVHQAYLVANITSARPLFIRAVAGLAAYLGASGMNAERATRQAYAVMYRTVIVQANTLAYIDTFRVLAIGAAIMFVLSFTLKKNQPGGRRVVMD